MRCIVLSYRPLSVGSTRRWPATYSHSLHVIVALERTILHPVLSYRPPWVGSTCVHGILPYRPREVDSARLSMSYSSTVLITRWTWFGLWWVTWWFNGMVWHICWIRWHIHELMAYYSMFMIWFMLEYIDASSWVRVYVYILYIFWESIQVLRRGVRKIVFEMIFEKTLFLPTHAFVLRPSRY